VVLGLAVIFGGHLYVRSQAVLYSVHDLALSGVESSALLIGSALLGLAYARTGFAEIDVYPSRAVLRSSLTVLFVGGYLFVVGVLAQVVRHFGGAEGFRFQAFVVLLGMTGLAVLLLSDRIRQRVHAFVDHHFGKAQHDSVRIWTEFSRRLAHVKDEAELSASTARFLSETFDALSVNVWLLDEGKAPFVLVGSTSPQPRHEAAVPAGTAAGTLLAGLSSRPSPFDLDAVKEVWAEELRRINPATFAARGGNRWCVPLTSGARCLGVVVLADRVNGTVYTVEELDLLKCIGDQMTSALLNLRLANEVARAKELAAFRTMSAFFVHDLKNAAASLNLMLKNLPVHFDNPEFRADALRGVGNTARRIDEMIARLSAFRQRPDITTAATDMNQIVTEAIDDLEALRDVAVTKELQPLPRVLADRDQIRSVAANLLINARDAISQDGRIEVRTEHRDGRVVFSVADNGCGMSEAFVKDSLFRPFQSTKKRGLGIGMFQSRAIVEAHGGRIEVESAPGKGTTFRVSLPATIES
jgi:putative PEP-CTERM system histidine kinase